MIFIKDTKDTPLVHISSEEGLFEISGSSFAVSVIDFYLPVLKWIENDLKFLDKELNCSFKLDMINSETLKIFTEMFFKLSHHHEAGKKINVKWIFNDDDEDIYEIGILLSEITKVPFTFEMHEDLRI
jgi:hypothetical protein